MTHVLTAASSTVVVYVAVTRGSLAVARALAFIVRRSG